MLKDGTTVSVGHIRIPPCLTRLLRPEMGVFLLCYLIPDLVDKPIFWVFGIGSGRYVCHTLLFLIVTVIAFSLWKRMYGLSALLGVTLHFILDVGWFMPWFYPIVKYEFPQLERSESFNWQQIGAGFLELTLVVLAASVILCLLPWLNKRRHGESEGRRGDSP
jgi:hypothetical protein